MKTVNFVYTDGVTYKATNVISVERNEFTIEYVQDVANENGTVVGINMRSVDLEDVLYAVVKDKADGTVTILPGIYENFEIVPVGAAVHRQQNIERESARVAQYRAEKAPEREAKEKAKYEARRQARKEQWQSENGVAPVTGKAKGVSSAPTAPSAPVAAQNPVVEVPDMFEQLMQSGISSQDLTTLRNVLK